MKIVSINVNCLLGRTGKDPLKWEICWNKLRKEYGDCDIFFIQEFPSNELKKLEEEMCSNTEYQCDVPDNLPHDHSKFCFCTIVIYRTSINNSWENSHFLTSKYYEQKDKGEKYLYANRCLGIKNEEYKMHILGVHIPAVYYRPDASVLWDDIIYFVKEKKPEIIIGDFNVDREDRLQSRKLYELYGCGYREASGEATRKKEGTPSTHSNYKSHIDYALIRRDVSFEVKEYRIDDSNEISDHYPLVLEIEVKNSVIQERK